MSDDLPRYQLSHNYINVTHADYVEPTGDVHWGSFVNGLWLPDVDNRVLVKSAKNRHSGDPKRWEPISVSDGCFYQITESIKHHLFEGVPYTLRNHIDSLGNLVDINTRVVAFCSPVFDASTDDLSSGDSIPNPPKPAIVDFSTYTLQMNNDGAHLWKLARPGNPAASLGQFIAELRELPSIPSIREFFSSLRGAGSQALNIQFGIIPFVQDLLKVYRLQQKIRKKLNDLIAYNGKTLHRKRGLPDQTSEFKNTVVWPDMNDPSTWPFGIDPTSYLQGVIASTDYPYVAGLGTTLDPYDGSGVPPGYSISVETTLKTTVNVRFVGNFYYYIPDVGSDRWTRKAKSILFGASFNADTIYSVIPWSWLIDWFSNVGDIISNASENAVENELATDAYVLRTETYELDVVVSHTIPPYTGPSSDLFMAGGVAKSGFTLSRKVQLRRPATPYGFGISFDSLSAKQYAILLALGFSRQRFL
jgi:hypothetical protein